MKTNSIRILSAVLPSLSTISASAFAADGETQGPTPTPTPLGYNDITSENTTYKISDVDTSKRDIIGAKIRKDSPGFHQISGTTFDITLNNDTDGFDSMTGFEIEKSIVDRTLKITNLSINLTMDKSNAAAGSVYGLVSRGHDSIISDSGTKISIISHAMHNANTNIIGADFGSTRISNVSTFATRIISTDMENYDNSDVSNLIANSLNTDTEMMQTHVAEGYHSPDSIVGVQLGSSASLSTTAATIIASSRNANISNDDKGGSVTGIHIDGTGSTTNDVYSTLDTQIINDGGTTTGIRVENTNAFQVQGESAISAHNTTGVHVSNSNIAELNTSTQIRDDTNNAVGLLMDPYNDGRKNVNVLKQTIRLYNNYTEKDNNSALTRMETDDFVIFTDSDVHYIGRNTGLGMDIEIRKEDSHSGLIDAMITVDTFSKDNGDQNSFTGGTYLPDDSLAQYELKDLDVPKIVPIRDNEGVITGYRTLTQEWVMKNEPVGNYNKTNIGLKVNAIDEDYKKATLNFGVDADIKTHVGRGDDFSKNISSAYGDVIQYETDTLVLNSEAQGTRVPNSKPQEGAQNQPDLPDSAKFRGDISYSGKDISKTHLNLRSGNFEFDSDHWYATKISFGDAKHAAGANKGTVSQVKLGDSTALKASELAFHVNDVDANSILIVDDGHTVDLSTVKHVDITLDENFTNAAGEEIVLIDGMIKDAGTGSITFNIDFVGADGLNSGYNPEDFHIKYRGQSYAYEETVGGFAIPLGVATGEDLVLVVGSRGDQIIPEPTSVSLSLIALTGLLVRRRRRRS